MFEESKRKLAEARKQMRKIGLTKEVLSERFKPLFNKVSYI